MEGSKFWKFLLILCALAVIQLMCLCIIVYDERVQTSKAKCIKETKMDYYSDEVSGEASNEVYAEESEEVDGENSEEVDEKSEAVDKENFEEVPKGASGKIFESTKKNYAATTLADKPICIPTEESSTDDKPIWDTLIVNCPSSYIEYKANNSLNRPDFKIKQFETLATMAMNRLSDISDLDSSSVEFWIRLNGRDVVDDAFCLYYSMSGKFILPGTFAGIVVDANWSWDLDFYSDSTMSLIRTFTSLLIKRVEKEGLKIAMLVDLMSCYENNLPKYPCFLLRENYETLFFYEGPNMESPLMKLGRTGCFNESICEDGV